MSNATRLQVTFSDCKSNEFCVPVTLGEADLARLDALMVIRRKVKGRASLFRADAPFTSLYTIRKGVFKTCAPVAEGRSQIMGFQMPGEVMGLDGIADDRHSCEAIALEDAEVCVLPFERIAALAREVHGLQRNLHGIMCREIVRGHGMLLLLGSMNADERLAAFLLDLARRSQARGSSGSDIVLRMTREEIGNYLGLTLETISRTFTRLARGGLLEVDARRVRIADSAALRALLPGHAP